MCDCVLVFTPAMCEDGVLVRAVCLVRDTAAPVASLLARTGREGEPCMAPLIEPQRRGQREEEAAAGMQLHESASDTAAAMPTGSAAAGDSVQAAYPVVPAGQPSALCTASIHFLCTSCTRSG